MAQKSIKKLYPKIEGDSKFGFGKLTFIATDTEPTGACEGAVYFDKSEKTLKVYTSDLAWVALSAAVGAAGTGLDNAYDINPNITVDGTTITLTGSSADVLTIVQTANNDGLYVSKTGTGSGAAINVLNVGTGADIYTTGGYFQVSKAGAVTAVDVTCQDITATANTTSITTDVTDGTAFTLNLDTLTSGVGLLLDMNAASTATLFDILVGAAHVMTVTDTGVLTLAGVAEGTSTLTLTTGDLTLTDGDITITSGQFAMTGDANADVMSITGATTGNYDILYVNGTTNAGSGSIIKVAQGAATRTGPMVDLDMGTTAVAMEAIDIDCTGGTRTVPIISIDSDGTASDFISLINGVVFTGNYIDCQQHAGAATGNFIFLNNDSGTGLTSINIDDDASLVDTILCTTSAAIGAAKAVFHVVSTGTPNATANAILVNWTGVTATNTPYMVKLDSSSKDIGAISVDSDNATDSTVLINCGGNLADNKALVELTWDGTPANAGTNMLRVDGSGGTNTAKPVLVEIYDDSVAVGLSVSTASIEDMVTFIGTGATGAAKAVVDITSTAALNATANLLRLDLTGADTTAVPTALEIVGASETARGIYVDTDGTTVGAAAFHSGGALTDGVAVVNITNDGNLAAGGNLLNVTMGGTPAAVSVAAVEIVAAKNCMALDIASSAVGANCVRIVGSGALTDGLAVLSVSSAAALAAGGNILNVTYTGTPATSAVSAFDLVCSKDCRAIDVVTSAAAVSAVRITGVGAVANDMALLEVTHGTGAIAAGGSIVRIAGNANAAGATAYGMTINCNATNLEALWVEAGAVLIAETLTVTGVTTCTGGVVSSIGTTADLHDTAPVIGDLTTAFGAAYATKIGWLGTVIDSSTSKVYLCSSNGTTFTYTLMSTALA